MADVVPSIKAGRVLNISSNDIEVTFPDLGAFLGHLSVIVAQRRVGTRAILEFAPLLHSLALAYGDLGDTQRKKVILEQVLRL
jgi:hypothetical protein